MINWLTQNKFKSHLMAFSLMIVSSIGMIFSMQQDGTGFIWLLVAIFAAANILAIFIK